MRPSSVQPQTDLQSPAVVNGNATAYVTPAPEDRPHWNAERGELLRGSRVVKRYKQRAGSQRIILDEFQTDGWAQRIDDPLPGEAGKDPKARLHSTINKLNDCQQRPGIVFQGDGTGEGVLWKLEKAGSARKRRGKRKGRSKPRRGRKGRR